MKKQCKKRLMYVVLFVFVLLFIFFGVKMFGDRGSGWSEITFDYLDGLRVDDRVVTEGYVNCATEGVSYDDIDTTDFLRTGGGMCFVGYWVEIDDGEGVYEIRDRETLINALGEIDTPQKAVTLIATTYGDLVWGNGEDFGAFINGQYRVGDDGIYVKFTHANTFGCGKHIQSDETVLVKHNGDIESVNRDDVNEALYFWKPEICVD